MTPIDDETLMAYADGELPPERQLEVERALAADPRLAARLEPFLASARLLAPLDRTLDEPLPPALAKLAGALQAPAGHRGAGLDATAGETASNRNEGRIEGAASSAAPRPTPLVGDDRPALERLVASLFGSPRGLAAAATAFALGGVIGLLVQPRNAVEPVAGAAPAAEARQSALRQALSSAASGTALTVVDARGTEHRITPQATMRGDGGRYCREYLHERRGSDAGAERGIACAGPDGSWQVRLSVAQAVPSEDGYRPASAGLAEFDALAARIAPGEPLSPEAEREAIARGWSSPAR